MPFEPNIDTNALLPGSEKFCRRIQAAAGCVALLIGVANILMWAFPSTSALVGWMGGLVMRLNAAIGITAAAVSLLLWSDARPALRNRIAAAFGIFVALLGGLTTLEYLVGSDLGVDALFGPTTFPGDAANALVVHPGRMSFNASASMFLLGLALAGLDFSIGKGRRLHPAPGLALLASLPAACGLIGYVLGARDFTGLLRSTIILLHTALALFVLCVGILAARPDRPPVRRILSPGADGLLLRWLLPGSAILLLLLAWTVQRGRLSGMVGPGEGTALMFYGGLVVLFFLLIAASKAVGRQETSARAADAARRAEELRNRAIVDAALDGVILLDASGRVVDWNPAAEQIFGWRRDEIVGRPLVDCIAPPSLGATYQEDLRKYLAEGGDPSGAERMERPFRRRDGTEFPAEFSVNALPGAGRGLFVGFVRDITSRQAAEAALRESEARFRNLADNISQLAWMTDETGAIVWYNQRWFDYTGTTLAEMKGWGWRSVHHPDHVQRVEERYRECLARGAEWEDLFPLRGATGEYRWFLSRAMPIRDAAGRVLRWFGTNTDVTEQRELSEALSRARDRAEEASRAKDSFLAALSHELRTPLTPALLAANALCQDHSLPPHVREDLALIERHITLESRLIDDLLDLTRITRGKLALRTERCDLHAVLGDAFEIVRDEAETKGVTVDVHLDARRAGLSGDSARLQQVFWNLLKNAVKFTPAGGRVSVRSRNTADGAGLVVEITDTGLGFAPEGADQLFKPFEQGNHGDSHRFGGLGLGLSIARAIVDLHGGKITAASPGPNQGAVFTVELPGATEQPPGIRLATPLPRSPAAATLSLLLVEDHESTLSVLRRLLTRAGFQVTTANSVASAVEAFLREPVDLLISDLGLPDGTGQQVMLRLRQHNPRLTGIALSGYGMEEDLARSRDAGFRRHLVKPVEVDQLLDAIRDLQEELAAASAANGSGAPADSLVP